MIKILNIFYKKQKFIEIIVILLVFLSVSFSFSPGESKWVWSEYPFIAVTLVTSGSFLALLWVKIEKRKIQSLTDKLSKININTNTTFRSKIDLLTPRQREIFKLIAEGKSNKEIIDELFIELSTLKTHINKIYKTLGIKNRKEVRTTNNARSVDY